MKLLSVENTIQENQLWWYGHVCRIEHDMLQEKKGNPGTTKMEQLQKREE